MVQVDPLARAMRYQPDEDSCWHIPVCLNYNRLTATLTGVAVVFLSIGLILTIVLLYPYSPTYTFTSIVLNDFVSLNDYLRINMTVYTETENPAVPGLTIFEHSLRLKFDQLNYVLAEIEFPQYHVSHGKKSLVYWLYLDSKEQAVDRTTIAEISRQYRQINYVKCSLVGGFNGGFMFIRNGVQVNIPLKLSDDPTVQDQTTQ